MRKREPDRGKPDALVDPIEPNPRSSTRRPLVTIVICALVLIGIVATAVYGSRLLIAGLRTIASDPPEKLLSKPIGPVEVRPMVSEPYTPDRLRYALPPPTPVPELAEKVPGAATERPAGIADPVSAPMGITSCPGETRSGRDICTDPELLALDARIAAAIDGPADPRFREYLSQRETWCDPQPSRANRKECLLDLGTQLLSSLRNF